MDVTDTGRGIPKGDLEKIFRVFHTKSKGGLGLGLPLARRIVEEHGGRLTVESEPGRGSRFSVLLPDPLRRNRAPTRAGIVIVLFTTPALSPRGTRVRRKARIEAVFRHRTVPNRNRSFLNGSPRLRLRVRLRGRHYHSVVLVAPSW